MRSRPFALLVVLATAPAALAAAPQPGVAAPRPAAGSPVLLRDGVAGYDALRAHHGPEQVDTTVEPSIAVNPSDPRNAVVGFQVGRVDGGGDAANGFATTFDAGRHWINGIVPGLTRGHGGAFDRGSDSVVAFGPGRTVYYSSLVFNDTSGGGLESAIVSNTSLDGGRTWLAPTVVQDDNGAGLNDKNWVVVDRGTEAGHHHGRVYVVWDRVAGVIAKYSDDQGRTWVPASPAYLPNVYPAQGIGAYPVVMPNGDLEVAFMADVAPPAVTATPGDELAQAIGGMSKLAIARFPGAGSVPTGAPLPQAVVTSSATFKGNGVRGQRAGSLLAAAADPRTGRLYVVWEDGRLRADAANDVLLASSDDAGLTWSVPRRVNGGPVADLVDHYDPAVAVADNGTVDVMWRQRRETAATDVTGYSHVVDTYLARSRDRGMSFGPALKVNRSPSDTRFGAFSRGGLFQGDYDQVATARGLTYVVRCEAYAPNRQTPPPDRPSAATVHHQTTWVAVLGTAGQ